MGLQDFLRDAKDFLLGNYETENAENFKQEIENALKAGIIDKATAAELIQTRNNVKKEAQELEKNQIATISLEDGSKVSVKDLKKKKEEIARDKEEKERRKRVASENANRENNNSKVKIDRQKLQREIQKEEREENRTINREGREGKN